MAHARRGGLGRPFRGVGRVRGVAGSLWTNVHLCKMALGPLPDALNSSDLLELVAALDEADVDLDAGRIGCARTRMRALQSVLLRKASALRLCEQARPRDDERFDLRLNLSFGLPHPAEDCPCPGCYRGRGTPNA